MKKILFAAAMLLSATGAIAQQAAPSVQRDGIQTRSEAVQRVQSMFARIDSNRDGYLDQAEAQALRGQARGQLGQRGQRGTRNADPARRAQAFARLDTNRDNMISREEWARAEALRSQRMAQRQGMRGQQMAMHGNAMRGGAMMRMADVDSDSRVSLQEATTAALQRFDRADRNRDGQISRDERQQLRQQLQKQREPADRRR